MRLTLLYPQIDSAGYTHHSAVWGLNECPALQIYRSASSWQVAADLSVAGPVPAWVEELILDGQRSPSGLIELFWGRRFGRLSEIRSALDQARQEGEQAGSNLAELLI